VNFLIKFFINRNTGQVFTLTGKATINSLDAMNQLTLMLPLQVAGVTVLQNEGAYNIWDTDYSSYALIYSCKQIGKFLLFFIKYDLMID